MKKQLMACTLSFALLLGMIPTAEVSAVKKVSLSTKKLTITKGKSKTLNVKNTKKKVTWKVVSGKKYISLKKKGKTAVTVKGVKKGTAKVQAKADKKNLTCTVTVKNPEKKDNSTKATNQPVVTPTASAKPVVTPPSVTVTPPATTEQPSGTQTPPSTVEPTDEPGTKNEQDVTALKALIAEQRGRGATVSENINNEKEYVWKNGRLAEINWGFFITYDNYETRGVKLNGNISFAPFDALETLDCSWSQLSSLDVSKNVNLTKLHCYNNELSSLDVSQNINLTELYCSNNPLGSLDVSSNVNLMNLYCWNNGLTSLDVSKNVNLMELSCYINKLTSLDVSNNVNLTKLDCGCISSANESGDQNQITSLDVSNNVNLTVLICDLNPLTSLDVSKNVNLSHLSCSDNQLDSLDVSKNVALTDLWCTNNQLSSLDVSRNVNLTLLACSDNPLTSLDLTNNTKLTDLYCDDTVVVTGFNKKEYEEL